MKGEEYEAEVECAIVHLNLILADEEWHSCDEVRKYIQSKGISRKAFSEARKELEVQTRNNGDGTWSWRMVS